MFLKFGLRKFYDMNIPDWVKLSIGFSWIDPVNRKCVYLGKGVARYKTSDIIDPSNANHVVAVGFHNDDPSLGDKWLNINFDRIFDSPNANEYWAKCKPMYL